MEQLRKIKCHNNGHMICNYVADGSPSWVPLKIFWVLGDGLKKKDTPRNTRPGGVKVGQTIANAWWKLCVTLKYWQAEHFLLDSWILKSFWKLPEEQKKLLCEIFMQVLQIYLLFGQW